MSFLVLTFILAAEAYSFRRACIASFLAQVKPTWVDGVFDFVGQMVKGQKRLPMMQS